MNQTPAAKVQRVSKALFGSSYRLTVAAAVARADPGTVFAKQLAEETGVAPNIVGKELKRFVDAGVLQQLNEAQGGGTRVLYERLPSAFWEMSRELEEEADTMKVVD